MREEKIIIANKIAGISTFPKTIASSDAPLPAVLMLHGFATGKNEVNGIYAIIASELAEKNIISLRVDFQGYGESAGSAENFSVHDMLADAIKSFHYLKTLSVDGNKLGVVGFSLGAAVALTLSLHTTFCSLALISPALDLKKDFTGFLGQETMRRLAACESFVEVDLPWRKIRIGKVFFDSLSQCNPKIAATQFNRNLLCIAGEKDFSEENAQAINELSPSSRKTLTIIPDADHVFNISELPMVGEKVSQWMSFFLKNNPT